MALTAHNQVRTSLNQGGLPGQPTPDPPLRPMMWDQGLADASKAYAEGCVWAHSSNRVNVGENLYASTNTASDIQDAVTAWSNEYVDYSFSTGACTPGRQCGHYTQIVWQGSILVGCAEAMCSPLRNPDQSELFDNAKLQVCQYATAGNIFGNQPYATDGGDLSLVPFFSDTSGVLIVPYALIWNPDNLVVPVAGDFIQAGQFPVTLLLDSQSGVGYHSAEEHPPIFDVNSLRLFVPNVDVTLGGQTTRRSGVLRFSPGSNPLQFQLTHFN
jgi:hypothetical protein